MNQREEIAKRCKRWLLGLKGRLVDLLVCRPLGHRWVNYQTRGHRLVAPEPVGRCDRCRFDTGDFYSPDEGGWFA